MAFQIDCFTLAIGPVEHDINLRAINNPNKTVGRLFFNIHFQHIQEIEVDTGTVRFDFNEKLEDKYYFTIQAQTPEGTVDSSNIKSPVSIPTNDINTGQYIQYTGTDLQLLKFSTTYTYLSSSCIRIALWYAPEMQATVLQRRYSIDPNIAIECKEPDCCVKSNDPETDALEKFEADPLFGECYISFLKLLADEMIILEAPISPGPRNQDSVRNYPIKLEKPFSETLWNCGKKVGMVSGTFIINDPPFLKQMICGAHTEHGFSFIPSSVLNDPSLSFGDCGCFSVEKIPSEVLNNIIYRFDDLTI